MRYYIQNCCLVLAWFLAMVALPIISAVSPFKDWPLWCQWLYAVTLLISTMVGVLLACVWDIVFKKRFAH